jgi:hypothetical protein
MLGKTECRKDEDLLKKLITVGAFRTHHRIVCFLCTFFRPVGFRRLNALSRSWRNQFDFNARLRRSNICHKISWLIAPRIVPTAGTRKVSEWEFGHPVHCCNPKLPPGKRPENLRHEREDSPASAPGLGRTGASADGGRWSQGTPRGATGGNKWPFQQPTPPGGTTRNVSAACRSSSAVCSTATIAVRDVCIGTEVSWWHGKGRHDMRFE